MRIGFDMMAAQSPHHGGRGIGRYATSLVSTLLNREDGHEYVLYVHDGLPSDVVPASPRAEVSTLAFDWRRGGTVSTGLEDLARSNPDGLEVLIITSPFEFWGGYTPPARPCRGLKTASIVYDMIPFLFQNESVVAPHLPRHYRVLDELSRYDRLLAISEATRRDCLALLGLSPAHVVNIGAASDPAFFMPDGDATASESTRSLLESMGITRPFVFNVGGLDERKNTYALMESFSTLPDRLRRTHQLVLTFWISDGDRTDVLEFARGLGLENELVLTGKVSDETLLRLYQRCTSFVFSSRYEGFGLPLLEAMHCGAAVLAGNNSSQIDVVGDAGLLASAGDRGDIAAKLARLLDDQELRTSLKARALLQAARFSWSQTADRALEAIQDLGERRSSGRARFHGGHTRKPRIAFFSPLPPRKSGISDYSGYLLEELRATYRIDLFHDSGYVPEPALRSTDLTACDYRLFDRLAAVRGYHAIVYQMGNSRYHNFMFDIMQRHPGVVTLHDLCLAGFHINYGHADGPNIEFLRDELLEWYPESRDEIERCSSEWRSDAEAVVRECATRGWNLERRVLDRATRVILHSRWGLEQVRRTAPGFANKLRVIPHGIPPRRSTAAQRVTIRAKYAVPREALIFASFGFIHPDKMSPQALDAFATIARENPAACFVFVGEEADGGAVRRHAASLGLSDRVRFLGRQPAEAFVELMAVTDVGVNLRLPPTNGETSGALLNLLASAVATIVTDVATFSDYPSNVVRKVRWERDGAEGLRAAMHELARDSARRACLGRTALSYVEEHHDWPRVAGQYVEEIERCHQELSARVRTSNRKPLHGGLVLAG